MRFAKPIGVDFAQQTVAKVNEGVPELDVRVADVRNLPFEDNEFISTLQKNVHRYMEDILYNKSLIFDYIINA
jgi:ubiquinone/menaquinone biosynthesis C-methylase UbiE